MQELVSTPDQPWADLAAELGGGWVPSLDEALADLRLRPVHDRVAGAIGTATAPAAVATALARAFDGLDRRRFDELRLATPLGKAGLDEAAVGRVRLAVTLPHPATLPDPVALAAAWLDDPDARAFLGVNEWDGRTYVNRERWNALVDLSGDLDRSSGTKRASPVLRRLRTAAEDAAFDVERLTAALRARGTSTAKRRRARRRSTL